MKQSPELSPRKAAARAAREARLAQALRDNLRRRKEQTRAPAGTSGATADAGAGLSGAPLSRKSSSGGGTTAD